MMNGVLLVNKPSGMTSHDVVAFLRRKLNIKRIGHTGTLDPNATGLLICLVGNATKIVPYLERHDKTYFASLKLGIQTDTADIWGETLEVALIPKLNETEIKDVLHFFLGQQKQVPPMVSAIKHKGKALYQYAREGISIERKERDIIIHELDFHSYLGDTIRFSVSCSAGTYIRTLCEEIGNKLETLATMSALNRTRIGNFQIENAYTLEEIEKGSYELLSLEDALHHLSKVEYHDEKTILNGKALLLPKTEDLILIMNQGKALAIYEWKENQYFCKRGLW